MKRGHLQAVSAWLSGVCRVRVSRSRSSHELVPSGPGDGLLHSYKK